MDLNRVLTIARQAIANNKLDVAVKLLSAASRNHADAPEVWYYLGTALGKQGGQSGSCCLCFLRTLQLLGPQPENKGHQLMASTAADNCWLMANSSLPQAWPAAAADAALQARFSTAAAHLTRQAMQQPMAAPGSSSNGGAAVQVDTDAAESHVQLLVVGGLGLQAMQLAAAASNVQGQLVRAAQQQQQQQQQGSTVPSMALSFVPTDSLTAQLAGQLFADNDLDDIIDVCSWTELQQPQESSSSDEAAADAVACAALLVGAVQPNWSNTVAACLSACRGLAGLTTSSRNKACVLSPACIRVWAVPVSCKDLLNLNEVDLQEMSQQTAGHYNYAAANAALCRSSRPCQVSRFQPQQLADPVVVLELQTQQLLQNLQQQGLAGKVDQQQKDVSSEAQHPPGSPSDVSAAVAAALCSAGSAASSTAMQLHTSGRLDCVVWWLEFELAPGCNVRFAPAAAAAAAGRAGISSSSSSSARQADVLRPHVWQHVQYLPSQQQQQQQQEVGSSSVLAAACHQGQQVSAGQQLLLQVQASAEQLSMSVFSSTSSSSSGAVADDDVHSLQQQLAHLNVQQQQQQQQQQGAGQILPYHLSMLNDHARTRAYDQGIAAAVQELMQQQQQQQGQAAVVLDVGCGTGLLSTMAATAAAAAAGGGADASKLLQIVACEREAVLAAVAQQLVAAHGMQQQLAVHQKLSSQLSVAADITPPLPAAAAAGSGQTTKPENTASTDSKTGSSCSSSGAGELPARAALVVHEIFGTDPLSEHVLPALRQVQQQLAAPGARFVPRAIRVIAAVATCPSLQQYVRLPRQQSAGALPFDVSSLLPLQPRKLELQLDDLASHLQLLTAPVSVLEFDFEQGWPLELNGQVDVHLPALEKGLLLGDWMDQQQLQPQGQQLTTQQQGRGVGQQPQKRRGQQKAAAAASGKELCVVSWFEADCGAGGWLSTAPGTTKYGHWQQSVEFVAVPPAVAAVAAAVVGGALTSCSEEDEGGGGSGSSSGNFKLCVSWAVDRLKFDLAA